MDPVAASETDAVRARYARRAAGDPRYSLLNAAALMAWQERQRALLRLLKAQGLVDFAALRMLEVGSGSGANLLDFVRMGFAPEHLTGIELLPERHEAASHGLPQAVTLLSGDAMVVPIAQASMDIVFQSTVFSSLLNDAFQQRLADAMWRAVKPGGAVLWYDFTVNNPRNPDVRGVPLRRVRALFPQGRFDARRVTLAPPLARALCRLHPALYGVLNSLPLLRTHLLAWVAKA